MTERAKMAMRVYSYARLRLLKGYATLNHDYAWRIREVVAAIREYSQDESLERPLNFLLLAAPGASKSLVSFNMATMETKDELSACWTLPGTSSSMENLPAIFLDESISALACCFDNSSGRLTPNCCRTTSTSTTRSCR